MNTTIFDRMSDEQIEDFLRSGNSALIAWIVKSTDNADQDPEGDRDTVPAA